MSNVTPISIEREVQSSYLDYAMSVIVSRALPDVRDGLKPVHRRILYGMWRLNLKHTGRFAKAARVVGFIMGYYHPHGDAPIYEALVRMAQDFSLRYPLITPQGNVGSIDGDPPAQMRYLEAKLAQISEELLEEIDKETVTWKDNFDGTKKEPEFLPAKLPQLLLNGAQGIAVGMATNIPPHNLGEIVDALIYLISHPNATLDKLLPFVKGPDFPTGGIIYGSQAIFEAYATGRGAIPMRAKVQIKEQKEGKFLVISELPYQVNKADLITEIAELVRGGKVEGIQDIIDGSRRGEISIVIELKRAAQPQKVLNQLYHLTRLQKNFNVLMIALVDGIEPRLLSLPEILSSYLLHRRLIITRRTEFDLGQAKSRVHILEGLALALSHIDEVVSLIKKSPTKDEAKTSLQKEFGLTELQALAILQMRLQTLAGLERQAILDELEERKRLIAQLERILQDPSQIRELIKKELLDTKKRFGDERKTQIIPAPLSEFQTTDLIPQEEVLILLTKDGYIKRFSPRAFHTQGRGGIGVISISLAEGDSVKSSLAAMTHDDLLFFSTDGRLFCVKAYEVLEKARVAKGQGLYEFFESSLPIGKVSVLPSTLTNRESSFLVAMSTKFIKKVSLRAFGKIPRRGIKIMKVPKGDKCLTAFIAQTKSELLAFTVKGQALRFSLGEIRPMGRQAVGVRGMRIKPGDELVELIEVGDLKNLVTIITEHGFGKLLRVKAFSLHHRGTGGMKAISVSPRTGKVTLALGVSPEHKTLFIYTVQGKVIKIEVKRIPLLGRAAQGVKLIRLKGGDRVASALLL